MFTWIIGSSLKFRFLVLAIAAALLFFGTQQLRKMPVDVFPEFAPPKVEIQTEGPGMTATEVEELITIPMEDQLRGVPGVAVRPLLVGDGAVAGRAAVQDGHRPHGRAPARAGAPEAGDRRAAAVVRHAGDAAAAVLDQPGHEDRALVEGPRPDGPVDDRLLDDQVPAACPCPAWPTFRCGASASSRCRCRSIPSLMRAARRHARRGHGDHLGRAGLRPADATAPAGKTRIDGMIDTPNQRLAIHNESPVFSVEHLAAGAARHQGPAPLIRRGWATWPRWCGTPGR